MVEGFYAQFSPWTVAEEGAPLPPSKRQWLTRARLPQNQAEVTRWKGKKIGKRKQKVTRRRRMMAQKTRRKMKKNREQKTGNKRDRANPKLKSLPE